ncbi:MAG: dUTP diphosphatase [Candidatus Diapherotrites archaeon]|nr:dUTP diphosphatase [Candidatus Diapherotrites archaeon]
MHLRIKKLHPDAILPKYAIPGDAGMDLYANDEYVIQPGERMAVSTGIALALPPGHVGLIWDKSGPPLKNGLHVMGGVLDETYRGEIKIVVINHGKEPITLEKGQKVAQLLIQPIAHPEIEEVTQLDTTIRGDKGFGSTGLK